MDAPSRSARGLTQLRQPGGRYGLRWSVILNIVLFGLLTAMYLSPWLALTRSMSSFGPSVFLEVVTRLGLNMSPLMMVLTPVALLSALPVLALSYRTRATMFYLTLTALVLFIFTLVVTVLIEVPIVGQITTETVTGLPSNWQQLRDHWVSFHLLRIVPAVAGFVLVLVGAIF